MRARISVAIPSSALSDESLKADKTRKVSVLARACAIFGTETIYVYRDGGRGGDGALLAMLLRYLETPQFLRRRLFPRVNDLRYAGGLHPLGIPSHSVPADAREIRAGDAREGIVVPSRGRTMVDVGIDRLLPLRGGSGAGRRVTVLFREGYPGLDAKAIPRSEAPAYWGYDVRERAGLHLLLREWKGQVLITSRRGRPATREQVGRCAFPGPTLVVFGSPERGVREILGARARSLQNARTLNFFPGQETRTVRLEEALLGTLSVINAHGAG